MYFVNLIQLTLQHVSFKSMYVHFQSKNVVATTKI